MNAPFPHSGLDRLAERVVAGEVVFFVGAGFSLDSEGNTADRLIARLLARMLALSESLPGGDALRQRLAETFALGSSSDAESLLTPDNLAKLAREYYPINDWMVSAFAQLLEGSADELRKRCKPRLAGVHQRERALLGALNGRTEIERLARGANTPWDLEAPFPLAAIELEPLLGLATAPERGKALFLETLGFADERVMGGQPSAADPLAVERSYAGKLSKRHQVLARLAREGLCPTLLTTNYDLLLDGALRLAGFERRGAAAGDGFARRPDLLPTTYQHFARIGGVTEFYDYGFGHRSALLVKLHGCAEKYRDVRHDAVRRAGYLPAVVFTYREIQNWREDAWSRDLMRTLLRTRTVAFLGYSATDQVIHDTFRSVYEEMARVRRQHEAPSEERCPEEAPAFFFGLAGRTEFHGLEILRSASRVVGVATPPVTDHPNYLRFERRVEGFPVVDELLLWLYHRTFRRLQQQALEQDLQRVASLVLRRPVGERELGRVRERFSELTKAEVEAAQSWQDETQGRLGLHRIAGWTDRFASGLLRELATGEAILRRQGPALALAGLRSSSWYFPATERPGWTAWTAVVELALRRLLADARGEPAAWAEDHPWLEPGSAPYPSLLFSRSAERPAPLLLGFQIAGAEPEGRIPSTGEGSGQRHQQLLELQPEDLPWPQEARGGLPSAETLWGWASGESLEDVPEWLGRLRAAA